MLAFTLVTTVVSKRVVELLTIEHDDGTASEPRLHRCYARRQDTNQPRATNGGAALMLQVTLYRRHITRHDSQQHAVTFVASKRSHLKKRLPVKQSTDNQEARQKELSE